MKMIMRYEAEYFVKKYQVDMIKKTLSTIEKLNKKMEKATQKKLEMGEGFNTVRTQAHWKAVASFQHDFEYRNDLYDELLSLDEITGFMNFLDQDRFKEIGKYHEIIEDLKDYAMSRFER